MRMSLRVYFLISGLFVVGSVGLMLVACESVEPATVSTMQTQSPTQTMAASAKGGAQVWANNCMRCHNMRFPPSYSDSQWDVVVHHMRVRANLTAAEHKAVVEFLKAAN